MQTRERMSYGWEVHHTECLRHVRIRPAYFTECLRALESCTREGVGIIIMNRRTRVIAGLAGLVVVLAALSQQISGPLGVSGIPVLIGVGFLDALLLALIMTKRRKQLGL